jgi:hypothetical protein
MPLKITVKTVRTRGKELPYLGKAPAKRVIRICRAITKENGRDNTLLDHATSAGTLNTGAGQLLLFRIRQQRLSGGEPAPDSAAKREASQRLPVIVKSPDEAILRKP